VAWPTTRRLEKNPPADITSPRHRGDLSLQAPREEEIQLSSAKPEEHATGPQGGPLLFGASTPVRKAPRLETLLCTDGVVMENGIAGFLDRLLSAVSAHFAIVVRKDGTRRRSLDGRWADGTTIGRPDKLLIPAHLKRVLASDATTWELTCSTESGSRGHSQAGIRVNVLTRPRAAILFGWRSTPDWLTLDPCPLEPRGVARLVAAAISVDELKTANTLRTEQRQPPTSCPSSRYYLDETEAQGDATPADEQSELHARFPHIAGRSPAVVELLKSILYAARSDIPVLVEGESGTGKELIARAIHDSSERREKPFVVENCGAVPENLVESEFFGHEKGAFTGANVSRPGLFERAHRGTVFLDEVGELSLSTQKRLLRVLQEKQVRRVGGQDFIVVDFRLVSATNRILEDMVTHEQFREDLFFRLNVTSISAPPLRSREGDVSFLTEHFNRVFSRDLERPLLTFSTEAMRCLTHYGWPGNVRELRNEVWRLASLDVAPVPAEALSRRILRNERVRLIQRTGSSLGQIERELLGSVLLERIRSSQGNVSEAARKLGITRSVLYRRLRTYGLLSQARQTKE
jgi:DNA-binding NtrC family response regulator